MVFVANPKEGILKIADFGRTVNLLSFFLIWHFVTKQNQNQNQNKEETQAKQTKPKQTQYKWKQSQTGWRIF
jgi:hypothetical protein